MFRVSPQISLFNSIFSKINIDITIDNKHMFTIDNKHMFNKRHTNFLYQSLIPFTVPSESLLIKHSYCIFHSEVHEASLTCLVSLGVACAGIV